MTLPGGVSLGLLAGRPYTADTMRYAQLRAMFESDLAMAVSVLVALQLFGLVAALQVIQSVS
jgi:hypothetical protein